MSGFDSYLHLLGIPPEEQPPNCYRLLNLPLFERNPQKIHGAVQHALRHLQQFKTGAYAPFAQALQFEIESARSTLTDPYQKTQYDQQLYATFQQPQQPQWSAPTSAPAPAQQPQWTPAPEPAAPAHASGPIIVTAPAPKQPAAPAPKPQPAPAAPTVHVSAPSAPAAQSAPAAPSAPVVASAGLPKKKDSDGGMTNQMIQIVGGGAAGIAAAILVVWVVFGRDPFGLFTEKKPTNVVNVPKQPDKPLEPTPDIRPSTPRSTIPITPLIPPTPSLQQDDLVPDEDTPKTTVPKTKTPDESTEGPVTPETKPTKPVRKGKAPQPSKEVQAEKLAALKETYKAEFEQANEPAHRDAFPGLLLKSATEVEDDATRFVLFREAYSRYVGLKNFSAAAGVLDRWEAEFDIDRFMLRTHLLKQFSAAAKSTAEKAIVIHAAGETADAALRADRYTEALDLAKLAQTQAQSLKEKRLEWATTQRVQRIEKAAEEFPAVATARKTLADDPSNAAARKTDGLFRCLIAGDWPNGLAALAGGDDNSLRDAAKADLVGPEGDTTPQKIGDLWNDLASVTSNPAFLVRAEYWYQKASKAAGLERQRIDGRLKEIEEQNLPHPNFGSAGQPLELNATLLAKSTEPLAHVDILRALDGFDGRSGRQKFEDFATDVAKSLASEGKVYLAWKAEDGLYVTTGARSVFPTNVVPTTAGYRVKVGVCRTVAGAATAKGRFALHLPGPVDSFVVVIDESTGDGRYQSYVMTRGLDPKNSIGFSESASRRIPIAKPGERINGNIECEVSADRLRVTVDGRDLMDVKQIKWDQLTAADTSDKGEKRMLMLVSQAMNLRLDTWELTPIGTEASGPAIHQLGKTPKPTPKEKPVAQPVDPGPPVWVNTNKTLAVTIDKNGIWGEVDPRTNLPLRVLRERRLTETYAELSYVSPGGTETVYRLDGEEMKTYYEGFGWSSRYLGAWYSPSGALETHAKAMERLARLRGN